MAKQNINVGTTANDKKGDSLRAAFQKVNANFTELYEAVGLAAAADQDTTLTFLGSTISTDDSSGIVIDRATTVSSNLSVGGDIVPQTAHGGDLGSSTLPWRSLYVSNNTIFIGGVAVGVDANGNLTVNGSQIAGGGGGGSTLVNGANTVRLESTGALTLPNGSTIGDGEAGSGVPITTARGTILLGNLAECAGGESHFHIMKGGQQAIDLFLGDDSNYVKLPDTGGVEIATQNFNQYSWTFGTDGHLTIPGDIKSNGNINIDINLSDSTLRRWQFGEDGNLTLPAGGDILNSSGEPYVNGLTSISTSVSTGIFSDASGDYQYGTLDYSYAVNGNAGQFSIEYSRPLVGGNVDINVGNTIVNGDLTLSGDIKSDSNINIDINLTDSTLRRWQFGEDGDTVFPNNVSINYSGGNVQFPRIIADSGKAFSVQGQGTSGSAALSWTVDPDAAGQYAAVAVTRAGDNLAKVILQAQSDSGDAGTVKLWKFDETGKLTLPQGGVIDEGNSPTGVGKNITLKPQGGTSTQALLIYPTAGGEGDHIHLTAGGGSTELYLGDDDHYVKLTSDGFVVIKAYDGVNGAVWGFSPDGTTSIPGDIKSDSNINIDINLSDSTLRRWSFGEDGDLTLAGNIESADVLDITAQSQIRLVSRDDNVQIRTNATSEDTYIWQFGSDGALTLPGGRTRIGTLLGSDAIIANEDTTFAVVTQGTNGSGVLIWIEDSENFSTSNLAAVYINPEGSGTVRIATGANGPGGGPKFWTFNDAGALTFPQGTTFATADGTGAFIIDGAADKDVQIYTLSGETARGWTFGTDGSLQIPGDIKSNGNINIDINLADSTLRRWQFGEDGILTVPGPISGLGNAKLDFTTYGANVAYLTTTSDDTTALYMGSVSAELYAQTNILIRTNTGGTAKVWTFGDDGNLTFPDATIQTTAFTANPTLNVLKIDDGVHEKYQELADATGTVTHDCSSGHIFYHASPDANWTVNLTNLNLSTGYATTVTIIIDQGGTGYYPNALQIGGSAQTINWQGNATPTPSTNRQDVVSFSILAFSGGYTVFGQLTGF